MNTWLARNAPFGESLVARLRSSLPIKQDVDEAVYLESFNVHWHQAWTRMQHMQEGGVVTTDGVNCVLNHVDQLASLLGWDLQTAGHRLTSAAGGGARPRVLDLFLAERVPERLLAWSHGCGVFEPLLCGEQLRMYEQLLTVGAEPLLVQRSVLRPLTTLLTRCRRSAAPELRARLVLVLRQLCVALQRQPALLSLFLERRGDAAAPAAPAAANFVLFAMLVEFVHEPGVIGDTARQALLLLLRLSRHSLQLAEYIVHHSSFCQVLATGLSGLYSALPRELPPPSDELPPPSDDPPPPALAADAAAPTGQRTPPRAHVAAAGQERVPGSASGVAGGWGPTAGALPEVDVFLNSLEFCNAVMQLCHPLVTAQLQRLVYHGFLASVIGPALHQSSVEAVTTATAYLELCVRSVDQPALVCALVRLLLRHRHEGVRVIDTLVQRIAATTRLAVVTLSLLHSVLELNCEDVLLELVLRHLVPCQHVMTSQRARVRQPDRQGAGARRLLSLVPAACQAAGVGVETERRAWLQYAGEARLRVAACRRATADWTYAYDGQSPSPAEVGRMERSHRQREAARGRPEGAEAGAQLGDDGTRPAQGAGREQTAERDPLRDGSTALLDGSGPAEVDLGAAPSSRAWAASKEVVVAPSGELVSLVGAGAVSLSAPAAAPSPPASLRDHSADVDTSGLNMGILSLLPDEVASVGAGAASLADAALRAGSSGPADHAPTAGAQEASVVTSTPLKLGGAGSLVADPTSGEEPSLVTSTPRRSGGAGGELSSLEEPSLVTSTPRRSGAAGGELSSLEETFLSCVPASLYVDASPPADDASFVSCEPISFTSASSPVDEDGGSLEALGWGPEPSLQWDFCGGATQLVGDAAPPPPPPPPPQDGALAAESGPCTERAEAPRQGVDAVTLDGLQMTEEVPSPHDDAAAATVPTIGPLLEALLARLELAPTSAPQLTVQLMTVLTRLSAHPQPLLRSFLLDPSVVLQPSVRSLIQTVGSLRHRIDLAARSVQDLPALMRWARARMEARLPADSPRDESPPATPRPAAAAVDESAAGPRRGFSLNSMADRLRRTLASVNVSVTLDESPATAPRHRPPAQRRASATPPPAPAAAAAAAAEGNWSGAERRLAITALLLQQWLRELAAVALEHSVAGDRLVFSFPTMAGGR